MAAIDLVVIGASAGGVQALAGLIKLLPADFGAAVLVVMHISESSQLPSVLNRCGTLPCEFVTDHPAIKRGHVYIAPPNFHMLVTDDKIALSQSAKENLPRPSIDPLFRSAARIYRNRVVGVILTGALDDGAAGLFSIKSRGGITIVQDPSDAQEPSMPIQAMRHTKVDYRVPIKKMGPLLTKLVGRRGKRPLELTPPKHSQGETSKGVEGGSPFPVSCPECQGPLFELKEHEGKLFHCRVGHAFSSESLHEAHDEALERAIWTTIRMLGEKIILHRTLEQKAATSDPSSVRRLRETIDYANNEIELLKQILKKL
jgi:two-component system chemotaxis response regulator CheB